MDWMKRKTKQKETGNGHETDLGPIDRAVGVFPRLELTNPSLLSPMNPSVATLSNRVYLVPRERACQKRKLFFQRCGRYAWNRNTF